MNNFFDETGVMAIGTRLKMLSERVSSDTEKIFSLYKVGLKPKWYGVFFSLSQRNEPKSITTIAKEIGHSHPSVIKIVKEMIKANLVIETKDKLDGRKNNISLSKQGLEITSLIKDQYTDVTAAMENMLIETQHNLWFALEEFENLLDERSIYPRVIEEKRLRESKKIKIVNYEEKYAKSFEDLNKEWINENFELEEKDKNTLEDPKEYIINKGGIILVALYENKPVGVCALAKMQNSTYDYELTKMAVSSTVQGKGIGYVLLTSIIKEAKELGGNSIYIETNSILKTAVSLYTKMGFKKISKTSTLYSRSNVFLELNI